MKIRSRINLTAIAGILTIIVSGTAFWMFATKADRLSEQRALAEKVLRAINDLSELSSEFAERPEKRVDRQWKMRHASMRLLIDNQEFETAEQRTVLELVDAEHRRMHDLFLRVASLPADGANIDDELRRHVMSQLRQTLNRTASAASRLASISADLTRRARQEALALIFAFLVIAGILVGAAWVGSTTTITRPLEKVRRHAVEIGDGEFHQRLGFQRDDEIGDLAQALDDMAENLDRITVSRDRLKEEFRERERTEKQLESAVVELEAKNAEMERFTYTVSHDLKSPLITIQGFLGLLERDVAANDQTRIKSDMEHIQIAGNRMSQLLDELLKLSRIGRLVNDPQEISLTDLSRQAVEMVAGRIAEAGVEVVIQPGMPTVTGDVVRLREVVQNLLDNAVKYMGDQPNPRIDITALRNGVETAIRVSDNGIGIDPKYHAKIFGLFDQLSKSSEGVGMGLPLVKRIVEIHDGRVWVESDGPGSGSTFCFTLPDRTTVDNEDRAHDEVRVIDSNQQTQGVPA
ncbi:MAG: ATP-binding protein [Verrucomicrobia bacterium]|nr:ATP-binding protein [Verrucomicrobiota bacterium]